MSYKRFDRVYILEILSLLYLYLPWVIFIFGWIKLPIACVLVVLIAYGLFNSAYTLKNDSIINNLDDNKPNKSNIWLIICILIISIGWSLMSGSGGYGHQNWDWDKHNSILRDLIFFKWPVAYYFERKISPLVYGTAFYLPAALIGKLFGWYAANKTLYLFSLCGIILTLSWVVVIVRQKPIHAILLFIMFGGLDYFGRAMVSNLVNVGTSNFEGYTETWQYHSITHQLFWNPNHTLAGWIITASILYSALEVKSSRNVGFYFVACGLWSPLVMIGLSPIIILGLYHTRFRNFLNINNIVIAPIIFLVGGLYTLSSSFDFPLTPIYQRYNLYLTWPLLFTFYLCEFVVYALFCKDHSIIGDENKEIWWWTILFLLFIFPLYSIGNYNDLTMRASIPGLFLFGIIVIKNLLNFPIYRAGINRVLFVIFIFGSFTSLSEMARSMRNPSGMPSRISLHPITSMQRWSVGQYLGNQYSIFFKVIGKPLIPENDDFLQKIPN